MTEKRFHTDFLSLSDTLYRVAFYILEDMQEAEDALQELFLKLWKTRDRLDEVQSPKAYCIRLLKNICMDRMRKAARTSFPEHLPEVETPPLQDEQFDARMRLDKVLEAVKALPDRQRKVLVLRTIEGLSYEEIAARTGMNYLTLRVLLSQARAKLKKA